MMVNGIGLITASNLSIVTHFAILLLLMFMPLLYAAAPQILTDDLNFGVNVTSPQFRHRLRDFIRRSGATSSSRRGKGSIARLAIDGIDPLQLPDPDLNTMDDVLLNEDNKLTRMDAPNFQPFQIVMPSNVRKTENNNYFVAPAKNSSIVEATDKMPEDYEKLAKFLQRFVSLQQNKKILNQNSMNITPKMQNVPKQTPAAEGGGIGDEHHAKFKFGTAASTNSAARGTVIGTVPVSVDIGHDDGMEQSSSVSIGNIPPTDEMKPPHSKAMDKAYKLEQKGQEKNTDGVRSWDGRVEKVTTLKMTSSSASAAAASASASNDDNANIGQPMQKQQLLGRIMLATNKNNSAAGNMELEEEDQSFFYQVPNKNGNIENAIVEVLREGFARQLGDTEYVFVASITLISDGGKTILVDTGMGTDINGRTDLIKKLSQRNIAPPAVNYVVITHGHPDHSGNTNDFPDAIHFQGVMSHYRTKFSFTDLFENAKHQLTKNVALISTPGHTSEDISVVVKNAHGYGTVVVSGDVFITAEDLNRPMMWRPLAWNDTIQEQNRRIILCMADFVVPGHGQMFRVSAKIKRRANCSDFSDLQHTDHA